MMEDCEYNSLRIQRKHERNEILNTLNLHEEKEVINSLHQEDTKFSPMTVKNRNSLSFKVVKKIQSPRRNSVTFVESKDSLPRRTSLRLKTKIDYSDMDSAENDYVENIKRPRRSYMRSSGNYRSETAASQERSEICRLAQMRFNASFGMERCTLPKTYGVVPGVAVGDTWLTRIECSRFGVHRPTVAGIHGGAEGAYSVAISGTGSYNDDEDRGDWFTYTGSGGRDLKGTKEKKKNLRTAEQTSNQTATGANGSLIRSVETKNPVRVIRGYKLNSPFAPVEGYRYDGLYTVEKYWTAKGASGFLVYKFLLRRRDDQEPAPWEPATVKTETIAEKLKKLEGSRKMLFKLRAGS